MPEQYAAFRLRFRALIIDGFICTALFIIGAILAGIILEGSPSGRIAVFALLIVLIIAYEPFMISRYGGTFGHQRCNIRIISAQGASSLPLWRAVVRSIVKQTLGLPSFLFMFITSRAQGLHDLAANAKVVLHIP